MADMNNGKDTAMAYNKGQSRRASMQNLGKKFNAKYDDKKDVFSETMTVISKVSTINVPLSKYGSQPTDKLKQCLKIWAGFTKYIRTQVNKNKIIDSLFLGTFYK